MKVCQLERGCSKIVLSNTHLVKNVLKLVLCQGRALDIFHGTQLLGHAVTVFFPDRLHLLAGQLLTNGGVIAEINLRSDNQAGNTRAVVVDLWEPLFAYVLE
jgi:hypothetical protein